MERLESFDSSDLMEFITAPQVKLIGTGGAGNNILDRLYNRRVKGVETIALNTDANHLNKSRAHVRKVIGAKITQGRGAGGDPYTGKRCAEDDEESINPSKLMTIWETGFKNKYHKEITLNNDPTHVIYLYPKNPGSVEYHTIILYISKEKNELKKVTMKTKDGTSVTYSLTKFTSNTTIADSKFVFDSKKYPGYNVIRD